MQPEPPLRLLSASDLLFRITLLRAELRRRPSHCQEPPPPQPATSEEQEPGTDAEADRQDLVDGSLILAKFPSEILVQLAETLGNPLALLVSKAHLSKAFCEAARAARATLTHIDLGSGNSINCDAAVMAMASGCPQLTTLDLCNCDNITDAAVAAVASGCKQLTTLDLGCCDNITDAAVVAVASGCKQLTTLKLEDCSKITDAAVVAVASACKQLTRLNLSGCSNITDEAVVAVASGCKQLSSLRLFGCLKITEAAKAELNPCCVS